MPFYHKLGDIPRVKHTTFFKKDGESLYREELISSKGFSGVYSNIYHHHLPAAVKSITKLAVKKEMSWPEAPLIYTHFFTDEIDIEGDFIESRVEILHNNHCSIQTARVSRDMDYFYRNAHAAEYVFVHRGSGDMYSQFGKLPFAPGDQLIIPRATTYQLKFDDYKNNKLLIIESDTAFEIPRHFRNDYGQMEEHAPYCERDFRPPHCLEPSSEAGDFKIIVKAGTDYYEHCVQHHPFGAVGWDGYLYPYAFNIRDYHAKVGHIHLPPPVHLAFTTGHFIICNFVPRLFDFHEAAILAAYFHSNIDSDEVLYYVEGDFMSRKGIKSGSVTHHPGGMPHGPQPGKTETSIGAKDTKEYAIMIDTFAPLQPTKHVHETLDKNYAQSWL